uniref:Vacuolar protein sorting-associated protein 54 n=1 Tax=Leptocylindrus danicus TaxID=163516 RepID=A0A7S2NWP7_9STRA
MNRRSSNRQNRQNRREQALADAAQVRWDAQNNFNLCQVVITNKKSNHTPTFHLSSSHYNFDFAASTKDIASNLYDSVFHLQEDYEHSVDWDEVPYLQRECPSYLQNLDMSSVEAHIKRASAGKAADQFVESSLDINCNLDDSSSTACASSSVCQTRSSWEDAVPGIFFLNDFDLTDPNIFEQIFQIDDESGAAASRSPLSPRSEFQKQQDILTQFLDVVESALLEQVKTRSHDFFQETKRFQNLKELVNSGHNEVLNVRNQLNDLGANFVTSIEPIPLESKKSENLKKIEKTLDLISDIIESKSSVAGLIAAHDYMGATETVSRAREMLSESLEESGHDIGGKEAQTFSKLSALSTVNSQLDEYEALIVNDLSNQLVEIFLSWKEPEMGLSLSPVRSAVTTHRNQEIETEKVIHALELCDRLPAAIDSYSSRLSELVKETIITTVNECAVDARSGKAISGAKVLVNAASMSFEQFMSCLDLLFSEILGLLKSAAGVSRFLASFGADKNEDDANGDTIEVELHTRSNSNQPKNTLDAVNKAENALVNAAELAHKTISEILRSRKDMHSLISLDGMRQLWDSCLSFTLQLEGFTGSKAYGLRSTLLAQAKAFVERKHENHMASLASALDSEKWVQISVSPERQAAIARLYSGRAALSRSKSSQGNLATLKTAESINNKRSSVNISSGRRELVEAEVEGKKYKMVWSCLLLVEMVMSNIAFAAHFQTLASNIVGKVSELLRLFNSRTTQLVLGAGAIHSTAKLKSINAKHLALVSQCLGMLTSILPHVRAALMAQLPTKQHTLLADLDRVRKDLAEHNEKVFSKFVSIVGGIVEHGLASLISKADFDLRSKSKDVKCCKFLEGIIINIQKLFQVLSNLLPPHDVHDIFSRIFAYIDNKVPSLFMSTAAASSNDNGKSEKGSAKAISFSLPSTDEGKRRMVKELELMAQQLQFNGVVRWSFSAPRTIEKHLGIEQEIISTIEKSAEESNVSELPLTKEGGEEKDLGQSRPDDDTSCDEIIEKKKSSQEENDVNEAQNNDDSVNGIPSDEKEQSNGYDNTGVPREPSDNAQATTIEKEEE